MKKGIAIYYYGKIRRKIAKFFYSDVKFNTSGPVIENVNREKYERYYNFLRRDNENIAFNILNKIILMILLIIKRKNILIH